MDLRQMDIHGLLGIGHILLFCQGDQRHLVSKITAAEVQIHLGALGQVRKVQGRRIPYGCQLIVKLDLCQNRLHQCRRVIFFLLVTAAGCQRQYHAQHQQQAHDLHKILHIGPSFRKISYGYRSAVKQVIIWANAAQTGTLYVTLKWPYLQGVSITFR